MWTVSDFFSGGGGASAGAIQVPGVALAFAANHAKIAVKVHQANHPTAVHVLADISQYDPRLAPRTPFAWFSPSCTHHTDAQGKSRREIDAQPDLFGEVVPDELAERSRATMWDVVRYSEFHRYPVVMVENVLEVTRWVLYRAWLLAMDALGYEHVTLSINSMHAQAFGAPAPQSRDRVYWLFWRKGNRAPDVERIQRPQAFCPACDRTIEARKSWKNGRSVGRYRQQYVFTCSTAGCGRLVEPWWVPAYTAIDWTNRGERIGDRKRGLSDSARGRIAAGIARHWHPIHLEVAGNTYDAASPKHPGYGNPNSFYRAWSVTEPMRTLHTTASKALAVPPQGLDGKGAEPWTHPTSGPSGTQPVGGNDWWRDLLEEYGKPLLMRNYSGGAEMSTPVWEPARTLTTAGHQSLITRGDVETAAAAVDDCFYRMIEPREAAALMAFPKDYVWHGTRAQRFRLSGNAVCPPNARDLFTIAVDSLS